MTESQGPDEIGVKSCLTAFPSPVFDAWFYMKTELQLTDMTTFDGNPYWS